MLRLFNNLNRLVNLMKDLGISLKTMFCGNWFRKLIGFKHKHLTSLLQLPEAENRKTEVLFTYYQWVQFTLLPPLLTFSFRTKLSPFLIWILKSVLFFKINFLQQKEQKGHGYACVCCSLLPNIRFLFETIWVQNPLEGGN